MTKAISHNGKLQLSSSIPLLSHSETLCSKHPSSYKLQISAREIQVLS